MENTKKNKTEAAGLTLSFAQWAFRESDKSYQRLAFEHLEVNLEVTVEVAWLQWKVTTIINYKLFSIFFIFLLIS